LSEDEGMTLLDEALAGIRAEMGDGQQGKP